MLGHSIRLVSDPKRTFGIGWSIPTLGPPLDDHPQHRPPRGPDSSIGAAHAHLCIT